MRQSAAGSTPVATIAATFLLLALMAGAAVALAITGSESRECRAEPVGDVRGVPGRLIPIYRSAASQYRLGSRGPAILAAINFVETDFGQNLGPSSAGAEGWMQFMPSTWAAYGVDGDGDGDRDPNDPWDAIHAAANYLKASGAPGDWYQAIFAYNHADWYVEKVLGKSREFVAGTAASVPTSIGCEPQIGSADVDQAQRVYRPRAFKALPARLWIGAGDPQTVDARIWGDAVWLLETFQLRVTAAREPGHRTHGDGTALDMVPAPGMGWDRTARRAAMALGWRESCGVSGTAPACPIVPAIQFVGYNGYESHGDPAHAGSNAHLHVSWKSAVYGCSSLCEPRQWVMSFSAPPRG